MSSRLAIVLPDPLLGVSAGEVVSTVVPPHVESTVSPPHVVATVSPPHVVSLVDDEADVTPKPLLLVQGNDPLVVFIVTQRPATGANAGQTVPLDLTGFTVTLTIKATALDPEPASPTYSGGAVSVVDAPGGIVTVQVLAAELATPASKWYHLDGTKSGKVTTLAHGPFLVEAR